MRPLVQSARYGHATMLAQQLSEIHDRYFRFWRHADVAEAILCCHPRSAQTMLDFLKALASNCESPEAIYRTIVNSSIGPARRAKLMLILEAAGFARPEGLNALPPRYMALFAFLDEHRGSFHGQMKLLQIEPSDEALLARPWWQSFYGVRFSRFPGDASVWQRWILPHVPEKQNFGLLEVMMAMMCTACGAMVLAVTASKISG